MTHTIHVHAEHEYEVVIGCDWQATLKHSLGSYTRVALVYSSAMRDQMDSQALRKKAGISGSSWHGDVFKVILCLSDHHPELSVRTIVGSGNPQTLVWRKKLGTKIESVKKFQLDKYMSIKYQDVFLDGPPDCFFVCSEEDAIRDATFGIRSQTTFS